MFAVVPVATWEDPQVNNWLTVFDTGLNKASLAVILVCDIYGNTSPLMY